MKKLVLAIDFDGCIVAEEYPKIGPLLPDAKRIINQLSEDGHFIIIWTCRTGKHLLEAELFLLENSVHYHKINQHHPQDLLKYEDFGPKIGADVYIDDKQIGGIPSWVDMYRWINRKANT